MAGGSRSKSCYRRGLYLRFLFPVYSFQLDTFQLEQEPENVCTLFVSEIHELNTDERPLLPSDEWSDLGNSLLWKHKN